MTMILASLQLFGSDFVSNRLLSEKTRNLHDVSDGAEEEITMWPIEV